MDPKTLVLQYIIVFPQAKFSLPNNQIFSSINFHCFKFYFILWFASQFSFSVDLTSYSPRYCFAIILQLEALLKSHQPFFGQFCHAQATTTPSWSLMQPLSDPCIFLSAFFLRRHHNLQDSFSIMLDPSSNQFNHF